MGSDNPTNPTATAPSHDNLFSQLTQQVAKMGRVRTKTVKKSAKVIIERYYPKLTLDFETDKRICNEIAIIASKRLRNKIAGYTTHLMKRIQRGPVRGISFKLQEESVRERINTSQRSPLSTSPRTRTVDNSRSTPRQRICSRALVSIPSQSVSSPSPNNKPSSPAAVSATTVLHAHRFRLRYEVRKQAKKSRFEGWDTCEGFWSGLLSRRLCWMFGRLDGWFAHTRSM